MMGKTVFSVIWLATYKWVRKAEDRHKAYCVWCRKLIDLGKMGEASLKSHEKSEKHKVNGRSMSVQQTVAKFTTPTPPPHCEIPKDPDGLASSTSPGIGDFVQKNDVLKSEILWTLQTVVTHSSYKSNDISSAIFKVMFPDSKIASKFTCGERKTAYMTVFGIAEHLKSLLLQDIHGYFVVLFDESLNKKAQAKQMDFQIRYWSCDKVVTRYLGSVFMGHGTAIDMVEHFNKGIEDLQPHAKDMIQISMDGPNVNWKFFELMKNQILKDYDVTLINIGSCGLHVMHNAFKTGAQATDWGISSLLSSLYYLFKDSPARREDFQKVTGTSTMPLKFVSHRWMENVPVCERALLVLHHIVTYVEKVRTKVLPKPTCKSFEVVSSKVKDPLLKAKLEFFRYIAMHLQPFLGNFQTDRPMTPFLMTDLSNIIKELMQKIVKSDVIIQSAGSKLFSIDMDDKNVYLTYSKVDIGFSTDRALKVAVKEKKLSDRQVMEFKIDCRNFITKLIKKLLDKCPVTYSLVRNLSMLNPKEMLSNGDLCKVKLKRTLTYLVNCNRLPERDCDEIISQYTNFLDNIPSIGSEIFAGFNPYEDRVDEFLCKYMTVAKYNKLLDVVKMCLVLSHGQASVERGFSVNKEIEVENLKAESLVAQRLICDYVLSVGGVLNVPISKELLQSTSHSRQRYEHYLNEQRELKKTDVEKRKRKMLEDSIDDLKQNTKQAKLDIESLNKTADEFCVKAEKERNLSHVAKSNSLRETAKQKATICLELESKLKEKLQLLKTV